MSRGVHACAINVTNLKMSKSYKLSKTVLTFNIHSILHSLIPELSKATLYFRN